MSDIHPKVVNLGSLPYVSSVDEKGQRTIAFHEDHVVERFPRMLSLVRIQDALEINLFLEHRYKGLFMPPKRGGKKNPLGGVSLITVQSLANSMSLFLPVYRYRKHLIEQVIAKDIDRDTANLYINHVRQFYEWARKQRRIYKVPFKYKTKVNSKPISVFVFETNINLLHWYRKRFRLGKELNDAISAWDKRSTLARSTTRHDAHKAQKCLQLLCETAPSIAEQLCEHGFLWFNSTMHFRQTFNEYPIKDKHCVLQSALFSVLEAYQPDHFHVISISINDKSVDVTDLKDIEPLLIEQLQALTNSDKFMGKLEHDVV